MSRSWIIVLNWNGRSDTLELLDSLRSADLADATVLVVDNNSSDGTLMEVERAHPWVRTLQTGDNLGFAGGNNRGIEFALSEGADIVGVLNNDTLVSPDFWRPLVDLAAEPGVAVSSDIRYADHPDNVWFYGGFRSVTDGWARHLPRDQQPTRESVAETEILTGCCLVAHAETWRAVGPFDEHMFLVFEDADWSMRAQMQGVRLLLEPRSQIWHKVSRSFQGQQSVLGSYYFTRNGLIFAARWSGFIPAARFFTRHVLRASFRDMRHHHRQGLPLATMRLVATAAAICQVRGRAGLIARALAACSTSALNSTERIT